VPLLQQSASFRSSSSSSSSNSCSGHDRAATHWQQQVQQQQQLWLHPPLWQQQQQRQHFQQQSWRHFSRRATRSIENPTLPPQIAELIAQSSINTAIRPDVPPLEERPMQFESRRAGAIAVKAGMMQDWDEYGARVPLTVLWLDECTVSSVDGALCCVNTRNAVLVIHRRDMPVHCASSTPRCMQQMVLLHSH
jgi:large subunit ribosomal protein L3